MIRELDQLDHDRREMMRTIGDEIVDFALALPTSRSPRSKNMSAVGGEKFDQLTIVRFLVEVTSKEKWLGMMIGIRHKILSSKGGEIGKRRAPVEGGHKLRRHEDQPQPPQATENFPWKKRKLEPDEVFCERGQPRRR